MQIFENEDFTLELKDAGVLSIKSRATGVEVEVEPLATGLSIKGRGKQTFEAVGRDHRYLVLDRLSMGMPPVIELR